HQSGGLAQGALREALLRQRTGREPDQGAQAAPRFRPYLLHQGDGQSVPAADPHGRVLADVEPARAGASDIVLARCPVRYDPSLPDQGGRTRHRDGHPYQNRPADRLPLPDRLRRACRTPRQAAALKDGAVAPQQTPRRNLKLRSPRHRRHEKTRHGAVPKPKSRAPSRMIQVSALKDERARLPPPNAANSAATSISAAQDTAV